MDGTMSLIMPLGFAHGWGVCGRYLALEMNRFAPLHLITEDINALAGTDPSAFAELTRIHIPLDRLPRDPGRDGEPLLHGPVLQAIEGPSLRPWFIRVKAPTRIGYTFFERTRLQKEAVHGATGYFDWVVAGSTWCEDVLRENGLTSLSTIIQGVDQGLFHSGFAEKRQYRDHFVIFSGGKMELRKGQDLVIRAFKVLHDKFEDVLLVNAWYNMWDASVRTMQMSPHITFDMPEGDYFRAVERLLSVNGIDPGKVITLPPLPHKKMAEIYRDTDCGLFPNRCEGGTNLVLMEYMACGKPVIASYSTGHKDVLTSENSFPIHSIGKLNIQGEGGQLIEQWDNPSLDEIIAKLEWAYFHRDEIGQTGRQAGESMKEFTWTRAARQFMDLIEAPSPRPAPLSQVKNP